MEAVAHSGASAPAWVLALVFATTWVFLFLSTTGLHNDHFMTLAWANQVLGGDLPVRDFTDPGMPLTYLASAAAQLVLGRGIWAEVVLSITLLSAGAALTCHLAARASGSLLLGLLLALVQVAIAPRLYSAPKIVLHLWAVWAFVRYADQPTRRRLIGLVACTATAFLVRHDHGVYIWAAATVLLVTAHWPRGARRAGTYAALVALTLTPFFVYVQISGGLVSYLRTGLSFSRAEYLQGQGAGSPGFDLSPRALAAPVVTIRWASTADGVARARVEAAHRLENPALVRERTWRYSLLDVSTANIRALLSRTEVEDTGGIDRAGARVLGIDTGLFERMSRMAGQRGAPWLTTVLKQENALAWMYRLFTWTPLVVLLLVTATRIWPPQAGAMNRMSLPVLTAAAVLGVATNEGFLRDPLDVRLADASAVPVVLVAWLAGQILAATAATRADARGSHGFAHVRPAVRAIVVTIALAAAAATLLSAAELGSLHKTLEATGATDGPRAVASTALRALRAPDGRPPIDGWLAEGDDRRELKELTRYVQECTDPADRLLVTWFAPDVYFYAERLFAAGEAFFQPGFFSSPPEEELALARLRAQRVPLVLVDVARYESFVDDHPRLSGYLADRYTLAGEVTAADGGPFRVLADRSAVPVRSVPPWSLPCFR